MRLEIDAWGFVLETGLVDIYVQRNALVAGIAAYIAYRAWNWYKLNK